MGIFRGESAYDRCEEAGWNVMAPPRHMKWTDCYRTGNRRAFVLKVFCKEAGRSYSYIVEGFPYRDSFGRSAWKQGCVLFTDQNLPPSLIAADLAVA